jgi:hypothetical protein
MTKELVSRGVDQDDRCQRSFPLGANAVTCGRLFPTRIPEVIPVQVQNVKGIERDMVLALRNDTLEAHSCRNQFRRNRLHGKCQTFPSNHRFRNLSPIFPTNLAIQSNLSVLRIDEGPR